MSNMNLMLGDCLERMKEIPDGSVDMVLTDPPYGTTACKWDNIIPFDLMWKELKRVTKENGAILICASQPFTSTLIVSNIEMFKYHWVWKSNRAANFAQAPYMALKNCEDVCVFSHAGIASNSKIRMTYNPQGLSDIDKMCAGKKANDHRPNRADQEPYKQTKTGYPTQILEFAKDSSPIHPTQKPVALMEYLIKTYSNEGETVLDFTMGSGSTGVAAKNLDRDFIGIEMNEEYFEMAKNRIDKGIAITGVEEVSAEGTLEDFFT